MTKQKNIILCVIAITFFILPVSAENIFVNGDLETGSLSPWVSSGGWNGIGSYYSTYHLYISINVGQTGYCYQSVDLTNVDNLTFELYSDVYTYSNSYFFVAVNESSNRIWQRGYTPKSVWTEYTIDVSGYSGVKNVYFGGYSGTGLWGGYDNIYAETSVTESIISFYPSETNKTPAYVNYSIIDDDASNDYSLTIYRNVSEVSFYIDNIGWYHTEDGSAPIKILEYGVNCTYYAKLYAIGQGYNRFIATTEREYIYDGSGITPFPTPFPTPSITPLPTFTPPPTPIPPDQPQIDNGSLNMSWLAGYYNLVDGVTNGLFHPIYNMTSYTMLPINGLSSAISNLMNHTMITFDIATTQIIVATDILNLIFTSIPDKILNVMTYYLLWIVILLILKGDT